MEEIRSYDSFDQAIEDMRAAEAKASGWISPEQRAMCDGKKHYFAKPVEWYGGKALIIFGWTWDWERDKSEWESLPAGEDREEKENEYNVYTESLTRGYVLTRSFSVVEQEGELGSHHASTILPISEEDFFKAKEAQFDPLVVSGVVIEQLKVYRLWAIENDIQS